VVGEKAHGGIRVSDPPQAKLVWFQSLCVVIKIFGVAPAMLAATPTAAFPFSFLLPQ
jgi:hypothetical protein